jgi:putative oxidoreductase
LQLRGLRSDRNQRRNAARAERGDALVHVAAGGMLAAGILPRLAALTLAGSLVPTTFGGHRFWEIEDPMQRAQQRTHFLKNTAILGGLLIAALD